MHNCRIWPKSWEDHGRLSQASGMGELLREDGRVASLGLLFTLVIGGVGFYLYDRHQKKLSLASESVEILEASINAYDACQTEKTPEGDKKDEPGIQDERLEAEVAKKGQQGASTNK